MSLVQSVVYDASVAKWLVTLTEPALASDSFSISITHSNGFSGFLPIFYGASPASSYTTVRFSDYKGGVYSGITSFTVSLVSGAAPPLSGTITLTVGGVSGTWSYNTTPVTNPTPGSANQATTNFPFDYSNQLNRIITALDQLAVVGASIASSLNAIAESSTDNNLQISTIATQTTTVADKLTDIEVHQKKLRDLGENNGIHVVGPWEWLGLSSIVKLYDENGVDYAALKARVDQIPKSI